MQTTCHSSSPFLVSLLQQWGQKKEEKMCPFRNTVVWFLRWKNLTCRVHRLGIMPSSQEPTHVFPVPRHFNNFFFYFFLFFGGEVWVSLSAPSIIPSSIPSMQVIHAETKIFTKILLYCDLTRESNPINCVKNKPLTYLNSRIKLVNHFIWPYTIENPIWNTSIFLLPAREWSTSFHFIYYWGPVSLDF